MSKSIVSIVKGTDTEKLVDEALSLLGGVESLIKPNSVVVIKPNAGHPFPPPLLRYCVKLSPGRLSWLRHRPSAAIQWRLWR